MDHSHDHQDDHQDGHQDGHEILDGPWAGGWLVAAIAGLIAAALARMLGEIDISTAFVLGAMVFGVFGALLGSGGVELTPPDHADDAASGHH